MKTFIKTAIVAAAALAVTAFTAPKAEAGIVICPPVVSFGRHVVVSPVPFCAPRVVCAPVCAPVCTPVCAPVYPVVRYGWGRHYEHGYFHRR